MSDPAHMSFCFIEDEADFAESVASYERGPLSQPVAPTRVLEFALEFPFDVLPDDTLLVSVLSESRDFEHRLHDGPPPRDGRIKAHLAAVGPHTVEVYWLSVDLIRPSARMTCGWSMEERFELPAPPHADRWRVELLSERIATDDGGTRLTRLSPME